MTNSLKTIIPLALVCSFLLGYQYLGAQWVGPSEGPVGGNVPAPVNVGSAPQIKNGPLGVASLDVTGDASVALDIAVAGTTTSDRVHAREYCDENGENCAAPGGGAGSGGGYAVSHDLLDSGEFTSSALSGPYVLIVNFQVDPAGGWYDYSATIEITNQGSTIGELVLADTGDSDGIGNKEKTTSRSFLIADATNIEIDYVVTELVGNPTSIKAVDMVLFSAGGTASAT